MTDPATLAADPAWIPHRIDSQSRQVEFLKLPAEAFSGAQFLADYNAQSALASATVSFDQLMAMQPESGPLHFVFHTAFCRSTLLARAMNIEGVSAGLSEPGILASLVNTGANAGTNAKQAAAALVAPCLRLLARPHSPDGAVFVKPTNHANSLIPALMEAMPNAKAVMMSNSLPAFLQSVNRKGLMGRRWARNLYLEVQSYAPLDLGIDARENFLLSDMQVAALGWLLQRRWFEANMAGPYGDRMRSLDSDRFNAERPTTLRAVAEFTGSKLSSEAVEKAAQSDIFTQHAKLGGDYSEKAAQDVKQSSSAVFGEEVAMVGQWIDQIAAQAGLGKDLSKPL